MDPYDEPHSIFWRPTTIAAGIVLLMVLLLLGYLLLGRNGSTHKGASTPTSATARSAGASSSTSPTTAPAASTGCSLPDTDQSIPETTPQGITWTLYQTVALPSSPAAGPQIVDGDIARCYAHTPLGALLAASQITYRYLIAPDWRAVDRHKSCRGPGGLST